MFNGDGRNSLKRMSRWLVPGMQVKRWLFVAIGGVFLFLDGFSRVLNSHDFNFHLNETIDRIVVQDARLQASTLQWIFMICGVILIYLGLRQWMRSIVYALSPQDSQRLV